MYPAHFILPEITDSLAYKPYLFTSDVNEEDYEYYSVTYLLHYRHDILSLGTFIKLHSLIRANYAIDITVVDYISNELRFNILYFLQSSVLNSRFILSTWSSETNSVISLQSIFPAFNWSEREIWDLYGLFIVKHPDLRRILTDYGFVGHPLRKDFPLTGFKEVQYEDSIKHVEYLDIELSQSYRLLFFNRPWSRHYND